MRLLALFLAVVFVLLPALPRAKNVAMFTMEGLVDSSMTNVVERNLKDAVAGHADYIIITIDSPGGSVYEGIRITRLIENSPIPVVCEADGIAASAAFYILQSCNVRSMTTRTVLMIHEPSMGAERVNPEEAESLVAGLKATSHAMALYCANRMQMPIDEFEAKIRGHEWWMTYEEALKVNAVDLVVPAHNLR